MSWRYSGLTLILITIPLGQLEPLVTQRPPVISPTLLVPPPHSDPEGRLAMGYPLPLACANVWSLELIKGISDTLALELIDKRREIVAAATQEAPHSALQRAHGIGDKVANKLLRYISVTERCHDESPVEFFKPAGRVIPPRVSIGPQPLE